MDKGSAVLSSSEGASRVVPELAGSDAAYVVALPAFEGPLDLLLHLIQSHELNILDIPIAFVTEKYLAYIALMQNLSIDLAADYLVMAATLAHIKSKMLLPSVPSEQQDDGDALFEEDPRGELVRRLLEYQKYKLAAEELGGRQTLGRDVFSRGMPEEKVAGPAAFAPPGLFSLLEAFEGVLKRAKISLDHEVVFERVSIADRITEIADTLASKKRVLFDDLFGGDVTNPSRIELVITFLAILEMAKLRMLRIFQAGPLGAVQVEMAESMPHNIDELVPRVEADMNPGNEESL